MIREKGKEQSDYKIHGEKLERPRATQSDSLEQW